MAEYVDLTVEQDGDSDLVRDLRKQLKNSHKERESERKARVAAEQTLSRTKVTDLLRERKLDPDEIGDYIPADVTDKDTLDAWLEGKGKIFARLAAKAADPVTPAAKADPEDPDDGDFDPFEGEVDLDQMSGSEALRAVFARARVTEEGAQVNRSVGGQKVLDGMNDLAKKSKDLPPEDFYAQLKGLAKRG